MAYFVKDKFIEHPTSHPQMVLFILETMFPQVELESVSVAYSNFSAQPLNIKHFASSVDVFDSRLRALEATAVLEVGGVADLSRSSRRNQNRHNITNGSGRNGGGRIVGIP